MLSRSSWLRRKFELWLMRKFMLRYGPAMLQRRGVWWFIDHHGNTWELRPTGTYRGGTPLEISLVERA